MLFRVNKFLCFELEIGGIVIGCLGVVCNGFLSAIFAYLIYFMYKTRSNKSPMQTVKEYYDLVMYVIIFGFLVLSAIFSYKCVKATKTRNPNPFGYTSLWLCAYVVGFSAYFEVSVVNGNKSGLIGLIGVIVSGYMACVAESLYVKFSSRNIGMNVANGMFSEPV